MPKCNIVIPFHKNSDTIDELLRSIGDQDYNDFDVLIIIDGKDEVAHSKLLKKYYDAKGNCKTKFRLYIETIVENMGASEARNYGAELSAQNLEENNANNVLFFIDADCKLYPGMLRECMTVLDDNKDVDFVYGNYRYEDKFNYISMPFDRHKLNTMNYISTMSPVRRRAFNKVGGFTDSDYFQDWSLFYRLANETLSKGQYINEFIFSTKQPTEESISGTKGLTLSEKAKVFRDTHEIEDKELVVTSWGAEHQALQRAKMLNADFVGQTQQEQKIMPTNYMFDNWKATYMVGCYNENYQALENHMNAIVGKPIYHFIGTDVFQLLNNHSVSALKDYKTAFEKQDAKLFVNSPRCLQEMQMCGFENVELLYTPIYNQQQYKSLRKPPEKFTVAVYFSDHSPMMSLDGGGGLSNIPLITEVARAMPTIKFKYFGGLNKYKQEDIESDVPKNIEFCGRIAPEDMTDFINSCSMIVRSTVHDGFPQLPIQFLLCGRQALVSCPDESMKYAEKLSFEETFDKSDDAKDEIVEKIFEMSKKKIDAKELDTIHKYYTQLMDKEKFVKRIGDIVKESIGSKNVN